MLQSHAGSSWSSTRGCDSLRRALCSCSRQPVHTQSLQLLFQGIPHSSSVRSSSVAKSLICTKLSWFLCWIVPCYFRCCHCSSEGYCCSECRTEAWKRYHWVECPVNKLWKKVRVYWLILCMITTTYHQILTVIIIGWLDDAVVFKNRASCWCFRNTVSFEGYEPTTWVTRWCINCETQSV